MKNLLHKTGWPGLNGCLGIEMNTEKDWVKIILTRKIKGEIRLIQKWKILPSQLHAFLQTYPFTPIVLNIRSSGIIGKFIPQSSQNPVSEVLGVKVENKKDFRVQIIPVADRKQWVSIIRTTMLGEILDKLGVASERVVYVNLSDRTMAFLIPGLSDYHPENAYGLTTPLDSIYWCNGMCPSSHPDRLISLEELSESIQIPVQWLGLYSTVIHFYLGKTQDIEDFEDIRKNYQSRLQKHTWGQGIKAGLFAIMIFLFLGGIAFAFDFFQTRYVKNQIARHQEILQQIQNNQNFISRKSAFLSGIELKQMVHSRVSFYIDQIASQARSFLHFEKLVFHPGPEDLKKTDPSLVELNPGILITGVSQTAEEITLFSLKIKELPFIEKVNVFQKKYDFQAEIHRFVLLIDLKP